MCELARANMLNGQPVDMLALIRLEGCCARSFRGLGIKLEKSRGGAGGLAIARARWAEDAARKATENAREAPTAKDTEEPPDGRAA